MRNIFLAILFVIVSGLLISCKGSDDLTEHPTQDKMTDNINSVTPESKAYARLQHIKDHPEEWGSVSQRGTELVNELLPIWDFQSESHIEEAIVLLEELASLRDPRGAEVFVNYFFYGGVWGKKEQDGLISIGVPAIPHLVTCFKSDANLSSKLTGSRLLGIITSQNKSDLGDIVDVIIMPGLTRMANSDPDPTVRHNAREALETIAN